MGLKITRVNDPTEERAGDPSSVVAVFRSNSFFSLIPLSVVIIIIRYLHMWKMCTSSYLGLLQRTGTKSLKRTLTTIGCLYQRGD